jgi:hypothetical protein
MGRREDESMAEDAARAAQERVQRMKKEINQKRVPSDPDRDTSGDSVYKPVPPEPGRTMSGALDLRDPVGPDSPVTINGFQTVQVMPLSQYDPDKDLLVVNVMVGKMRPDRAREYMERVRNEIEICVKPTGWKHIMYVPVAYDHPMHRQFRTVNVIDCHGMSSKEKQAVLDKMHEELGPLGGPDANHISGKDYLTGDIDADDPPLPWED